MESKITQNKKIMLGTVVFFLLVIVLGGLFVIFNGKSRREKPVTTPGVSTSSPTTTPQQTQVDGFNKEVTYTSGGQSLKAYLCKPEGVGPFPSVMFNHGGSGDQIGGDPQGVCKELAKGGFVGFSPIRTADKSMDKNIKNVQDALTYLKGLGFVDAKRMGMIGFSRGVLLTYDAATKAPNDFKGLVFMAGGIPTEYAEGYSKAAGLKFPVLLLVAQNDTPAKLNGNQNMVDVMTDMKTKLEAAGVAVRLKVYPPYSEGHGHTMFFKVGDYWKDVEQFFSTNLKK